MVGILLLKMQGMPVQKGETVDLALLLFNRMSQLHSTFDAKDCLECIHDALNPAGMLIIELPPVSAIFDGSFVQGDYWEEPIKGQDEVSLITEYGTDDDEFDPETQVIFQLVCPHHIAQTCSHLLLSARPHQAAT